ncbi:MAG: hypothetical protein K0R26_2950 [Bacteroidota bacterium]|jgi:hypothetical protein|nr:hypothetical protein [Bacteroidota bacterium]
MFHNNLNLTQLNPHKGLQWKSFWWLRLSKPQKIAAKSPAR